LPGAGEVIGMQRYLLVLDTGLPVTRKELDRGPVSLLAARQEQEPGEVVVSLAATGQAKSSLDLLLGTALTLHMPVPAKYPLAARPGHGVNVAAERRMNLAVQGVCGVLGSNSLWRTIRTPDSRQSERLPVMPASEGVDRDAGRNPTDHCSPHAETVTNQLNRDGTRTVRWIASQPVRSSKWPSARQSCPVS
jgi:hypothetical protein